MEAQQTGHKLKSLRDQMPRLAALIDEKRAQWGAEHVRHCIRQGMAGHADWFYGMEAGRTVGTPFTISGDLLDIAERVSAAVGGTYLAMREPDSKGK